MPTREERRYGLFKAAVEALTTGLEQRSASTQSSLATMLVAATGIPELLKPAQDNPLLGKRATLRKQLWPLVAGSHTLEICLDVRLQSLFQQLRSSLDDIAGNNVVFLESSVATAAADLPRSDLRVDQIVFSQRLLVRYSSAQPSGLPNTVRTETAGTSEEPGIELLVHQPFFLKVSRDTSKKMAIAALTTPIIVTNSPDGELLAPTLESKLVSGLFAGELQGEIPLNLPKELFSLGLEPHAVRLQNSLARLYYSNRNRTTIALDAPAPSAKEQIAIKLTSQLLVDLFWPRVIDALSGSGVSLESLTIQPNVASQVLIALIVGSQRDSRYIGNVKFWGKGKARVRQVVKPGHEFGNLTMRSEGPSQLDGEPWVSEAGAHVDTGIGGGFGVALPDAAVDILYNLAKLVGLRLPVALTDTTFAETIAMTPFSVEAVQVRSTDLVLILEG